MKVYIVMRDVYHEGSYVSSVHAVKEGAEKRADELNKALHKYAQESYSVEEHEIES